MNRKVSNYVVLNGRLTRGDRARISIYDRGLQYGDGLFETLRVYGGRVFALGEHLQRLAASARFLGIPLPTLPWGSQIIRLLAKNELHGDAWVRIVVTRGVAAPGLLPPSEVRPTVMILAGTLDAAIAKNQRHGVRVELLPYANGGPLVGHKTLDYLPAILGKQIAQHCGAYESLYVDGRGYLSEGTTSNVFVVRGGKLLTPVQAGVLPGVTRRKVFELAAMLGLSAREGAVSTRTLLDADEAFLSSSLAEIIPIVRIGERYHGNARPGPVTRQIQRAYRALTTLPPNQP